MSLKAICLKKIELRQVSSIYRNQDPGCPALPSKSEELLDASTCMGRDGLHNIKLNVETYISYLKSRALIHSYA